MTNSKREKGSDKGKPEDRRDPRQSTPLRSPSQAIEEVRPTIERPNYYHGQLLQEGDFITEQSFHMGARQRHNQVLHGAGIVRGLEVRAESRTSLRISPGYAVDTEGRELDLDQPLFLSMGDFPGNVTLAVRLSYSEDVPPKESSRVRLSVVARIDSIAATNGGVFLAKVVLNGKGEIEDGAIDGEGRVYVQVAPDAARPVIGWLRLPFRPVPLNNKIGSKTGEVTPEEGEELIDAGEFRFGPTEVRSQKNVMTAGTMALPLMPQASRVLSFRIAGRIKLKDSSGKSWPGRISLTLAKGGWNPDLIGKGNPHVDEHLIQTVIEESAAYDDDLKCFDQILEVGNNGELDTEYSTLSLRIVTWGYVSISLVAAKLVGGAHGPPR